MLNAFGYEIMAVHGCNNRYFVGDRTFELPEVQVLLHAVGAAKFFTERTASVLTEKSCGTSRRSRTAQKVKQLLGAIFSLAVEDNEFKNPMIKIKLPHYEVKKGTPLSKEEKKAYRIL